KKFQYSFSQYRFTEFICMLLLYAIGTNTAFPGFQSPLPHGIGAIFGCNKKTVMGMAMYIFFISIVALPE
ncbi:hypothetical protein, partial [Parvimonas micra]|uniref:hypothetical protein n=1 Tax=Parvimonas micra TaxID=33033 RepID=UPI002B47080A